jgi:alkylhydroperoxidase family enzyme
VRRLTGDEHLTSDFATTWRTYELDEKTRALLAYASKLTESPGMLDTSDFDALRSAGWNEDGIYEATALTGFFNFSGRLEAASGLLPDTIADDANPAEVRNTNR